MPELAHLLRSKAVLLPGVKVTLHVEKGKEVKTQTWPYPGGLTRLPAKSCSTGEPGHAALRRRTYLGKPKDGDDVRRRRRRGLGVRLHEDGARCARATST